MAPLWAIKLLITQMSALLQLHFHSQLNTWLQWIGQRQLQDETRNIHVLGLGAAYIRELKVHSLARPSGRRTGCIFRAYYLIYVLPQSLCSMEWYDIQNCGTWLCFIHRWKFNVKFLKTISALVTYTLTFYKFYVTEKLLAIINIFLYIFAYQYL